MPRKKLAPVPSSANGQPPSPAPAPITLVTLTATELAQVQRWEQVVQQCELQLGMLRKGLQAQYGELRQRYGLPSRFQVNYQTGVITGIRDTQETVSA